MTRYLLLLALAVWPWSSPGLAQEAPAEDEAWINAHMQTHPARRLRQGENPAPVSVTRIGPAAASAEVQRDVIAVSDLGRFVGRNVVLHLDSGRHHRGVLKRVEGPRILLAARMYGGDVELELKREQIRRAELE